MKTTHDAHCHILPGVDDGARDTGVSVRMLDAAEKCGIRSITATPHLLTTDPAYTKAVGSAFERLLPEAQKRNIRMTLAYEVNYIVLSEIKSDADLLKYCPEGTNQLLLELPYDYPFPNWTDTIRELTGSYEVMIAHPERYAYLIRSPELIDRIRAFPCKYMVSASTLTRMRSLSMNRALRRFLSRGAVLSSDAHDPEDYAAFQKLNR